jgi:hypothetical protein
VIKGFT